MIAVDTNILVYAHRRDSSFHQAAKRVVTGLAEGRAAWALPWACLHEFMGIVTHPRIYSPPSTRSEAIDQIDAWLGSPSCTTLGENDRHWDTLMACVIEAKVAGAMIHDARIAAICEAHGVRELWTADRDFSRFKKLTVRNPLV